MAREIPVGSSEIKEGLYLYAYVKVIGTQGYTFKQLFAKEGYHFYNHTLPIEERAYMEWCSLGFADSENNYTSELIVVEEENLDNLENI